MPQTSLEDLLRQADAASGAPALPSDLAGRVLRRARRRRRAAVAGWAAAAAVVLAVGAAALLRSGIAGTGEPDRQIARPGRQAAPASGAAGRPPAASGRAPLVHPPVLTEAERLRAEIARLRAEGDSRMAVVQHMLALERRRENARRHRRRVVLPDPADEVQRHMDKAALVMVYQADRLSRWPDQQVPAREIYLRTIELFPQTRWADVARQRLQN